MILPLENQLHHLGICLAAWLFLVIWFSVLAGWALHWVEGEELDKSLKGAKWFATIIAIIIFLITL